MQINVYIYRVSEHCVVYFIYVVTALDKYMYLVLAEPSAFVGNPAARRPLYSEIQAQIERSCLDGCATALELC